MTLKLIPAPVRRSPTVKAGVLGGLGYVSAVIVNLVTSDASNAARFWLLLGCGLVACIVTALLAYAFEAGNRAERLRLDRENAAHSSGYQTLSGEISRYTELARRFEPDDPAIATTVVDLMFRACSDLYSTLETEYGYKVSVDEHIDFEVTFMTSSLKDGEITIAAWANRDRRAPKSLTARKKNPKIYAGTETDLLYKDENKTARFISSTSNSAYKELYPRQKTRIKSSVVWPVVDDMFELLGTLVVHCDHEEFFSNGAEKFWREMLEPYAKRLALGRVLADRFGGGTRPNLF